MDEKTPWPVDAELLLLIESEHECFAFSRRGHERMNVVVLPPEPLAEKAQSSAKTADMLLKCFGHFSGLGPRQAR